MSKVRDILNVYDTPQPRHTTHHVSYIYWKVLHFTLIGTGSLFIRNTFYQNYWL